MYIQDPELLVELSSATQSFILDGAEAPRLLFLPGTVGHAVRQGVIRLLELPQTGALPGILQRLDTLITHHNIVWMIAPEGLATGLAAALHTDILALLRTHADRNTGGNQ